MAALISLFFSTVGAAAQPAPHTVIVISIDGFRADYIDRGFSPHLMSLKASGAYARAMRPSYPSVTEPNHYTLMTGLYPDHHGVVDNTMIDPSMPGEVFGKPPYTFDNDPRWWDGATPIWASAAKAGTIVASSGWPGTEARVHDVSPAYLQTWNPQLKPTAQTQVVLGWLSLPAALRPKLVLLHYDPVDNTGHAFGPDSPQVNAAIRDVDAAVGQLFDGLKQRRLAGTTDVVIVSDHGMSAVGPNRIIWLDDLFKPADAIVPSFGAYAGVDPLPGHEAEVAAALLKPHDHMTCWKKSEIPPRLHFGTNPRVPAIWCDAEDGWLVVTHAIAAAYGNHPIYGDHGYDPADPKMAALFLAVGPDFRKGVTVPDFANVNVYPMLARLLEIAPLASDGDDSLIRAALK
jgi:predicted AlkP superfamily pyrophosphatase or phosphodiesterase